MLESEVSPRRGFPIKGFALYSRSLQIAQAVNKASVLRDRFATAPIVLVMIQRRIVYELNVLVA